jgi:hypothetical protein
MKMEGMSGSGKTTAAKLLSLLIYGENMVGRSSTASDYSMASTEPLIIKDNMETDDINRNALNFLLLAATGATNIKRAQGTESGVVTEKINCLVAITAIEPFAKPELINRTFIVDFSKRYQRKEFVETDAVIKLMARRDDILSAWLLVLAEKVLPSLAERGKVIQYIKEHHREYAKERVTEFTALLTLLCKALVRYMPLPEELKAEAGDRAPEYVLLDAVWVELMGALVYRRIIQDPDGRPTGHQIYHFDCTTADLLAMLNRYGREYGIRVPFSNAKQLGVRVANELETLRRGGWQTGMVKVIHGNRISRWQWSDAEDAPAPPPEGPARKIAPKAQSVNADGAPGDFFAPCQ